MVRHSIGVVGGMGSYATSYFFQKLLDEFPAEKEWERPRIIIDNNCIMPSRVRAILYNEDTAELTKALSQSINGLVTLGCNKIILACITSHYFFNRLEIEQPKSFEFINLLTATASVIKEKEVYVYCTEGTAQVKLWDQYFHETCVIYPDDKTLQILRFFIEAVKQNKITEEIIEKFACFIDSSPHEAVILGCTELPVLYELAEPQMKLMKKNVYNPLQCGIEELKKRICQ